MEQAKRLDRDSEHSSSSESEHSSSDDDETSDDDDEEDDTEELLRELEKIKRERAEEKRRQEAEAAEDAERARQEQLLSGNPLLNQKPHDFSVKRRWDDDVVFRNQAKGVDDKPKKRFVNDLIRSDFHRKFMEKYVR
jgi:protein CWC15